MKLSSLSLQTTYNHKYQLSFNKETWCVQEMYWHFLYKYKYETENCQKAVVRLGDSVDIENLMTLTSDVVVLQCSFDFEFYFSQDKFLKKRILLDILHESLLRMANKYGWDEKPLIQSYEYCVDRNLENKWLLRDKYISSPNRKHKGGFICEWNIDSFEVYGVILDNNLKEITKKRILRSDPHLAEFIYYTKFKWEDNQKLSLFSKNGAKKWSLLLEGEYDL